MKINIIVAYADNYVIGKDNEIPWKYSEDLQYFKKITTETINKQKKNIVIMGKKTFESLQNKPLKNRINIVITSHAKKYECSENLYFSDSLGITMELCNNLINDNIAENIFIIGGESIYEYFFKSYYYKYLDKVYITRIDKKIEGNKFFYGLEDKFYYLDIRRSDLYPELEYKVLQYQSDFKNPELIYLNCLKNILRDENIEMNTELNKNILINDEEFILNLNLNLYFPLFSILKNKKDLILKMTIDLINKEQIINMINDIILKKSKIIDLNNIKPFNSIYNFEIDELTNKIELNVIHEKANILNELLYNVLFSSLMLVIISKQMNLTNMFVNYKCKKTFILETDINNVETIAWNTPDALPLLNLNNNKKYNSVKDYKFEDLYFFGLNI